MKDSSEVPALFHEATGRQADWRSPEDLRRFHQADISRLRRLLNRTLDRLEEDMRRPADPEDADRDFWWGSRENVVTILGKLSQILLKLVPLEQKIAATDEEVPEGTALSQEDISIIEHYVERIHDGDEQA